MLPGTLTAPGPGRSSMLSTSGFPEVGLQNVPASVVENNVGPPRSGEPVIRIARVVARPNAPGVR
jgi:hypothetical protein